MMGVLAFQAAVLLHAVRAVHRGRRTQPDRPAPRRLFPPHPAVDDVPRPAPRRRAVQPHRRRRGPDRGHGRRRPAAVPAADGHAGRQHRPHRRHVGAADAGDAVGLPGPDRPRRGVRPADPPQFQAGPGPPRRRATSSSRKPCKASPASRRSPTRTTRRTRYRQGLDGFLAEGAARRQLPRRLLLLHHLRPVRRPGAGDVVRLPAWCRPAR